MLKFKLYCTNSNKREGMKGGGIRGKGMKGGRVSEGVYPRGIPPTRRGSPGKGVRGRVSVEKYRRERVSGRRVAHPANNWIPYRSPPKVPPSSCLLHGKTHANPPFFTDTLQLSTLPRSAPTHPLPSSGPWATEARAPQAKASFCVVFGRFSLGKMCDFHDFLSLMNF